MDDKRGMSMTIQAMPLSWRGSIPNVVYQGNSNANGLQSSQNVFHKFRFFDTKDALPCGLFYLTTTAGTSIQIV